MDILRLRFLTIEVDSKGNIQFQKSLKHVLIFYIGSYGAL